MSYRDPTDQDVNAYRTAQIGEKKLRLLEKGGRKATFEFSHAEPVTLVHAEDMPGFGEHEQPDAPGDLFGLTDSEISRLRDGGGVELSSTVSVTYQGEADA